MQEPLGIKPNLFIVGQPKSGTSALFSFLKDHPDVCACATKEPQFFCKDINSQYFHLSNMERSEENFLKLFSHCANQKILMEASTAYLYSRVAAEEIYNFNPDAKIIIMLREPVDFLFTYHMQMLRTSCAFEEIDDFLKALELEPLRKKGQHIPENCFDHQFLFYSDRTRYTDQIKRYRERFPENQIKIIVYDDFKSNNRAVYDEVAAFLDLDASFRPEFKTVNAKVGVRFRRLKQSLDQLLFPFKQWVRPQVSSSVYNFARSSYRRLFFKQYGLPTLRAEDKLLLMQRHKEEVEQLSNYLNRDLISLWGYDKI